jgi:N utilization substance protein A
MVVSELRGEKIDIIPYSDEPARFVAKALSPARVREVLVDDEQRQATVIVPDDQLSLAIGREGQNARLAARLTGWRIDIRSETEFATEAQESSYEQEDQGGRCAAIMSTGRRCPNAALPGSAYCGLPAHQALSRFAGSSMLLVQGLSDEEVSKLADPDLSQEDVSDIVARAEQQAAELEAQMSEAQAAAEAAGEEAEEAGEEAADAAPAEDAPAGEEAAGDEVGSVAGAEDSPEPAA